MLVGGTWARGPAGILAVSVFDQVTLLSVAHGNQLRRLWLGHQLLLLARRLPVPRVHLWRLLLSRLRNLRAAARLLWGVSLALLQGFRNRP